MYTEVDKLMDEACEAVELAKCKIAAAVAEFHGGISVQEYHVEKIDRMADSISILSQVRAAIPRG